MNESVERRIQKVEAFVATAEEANALPRVTCEFLYGLILATGARRGVEVGTSYGFSGLWLGAAFSQNHGSLVTIDNDIEKHKVAQNHFEQAGLGSQIELVHGEAADALAAITGKIDFVLLDADKENCRQYVEIIQGNLSERAVVAIDNTLTHAEEMESFLSWIRTNDQFYCCHLELGNGLELATRWPRVRRSQGVFGM